MACAVSIRARGKKMKLDVLNCIETDGEIIVSLDVDEEGRQYLIERGFNAILIDAIKLAEDTAKLMEEDHEREPPLFKQGMSNEKDNKGYCQAPAV
jgi:hypothetical protein